MAVKISYEVIFQFNDTSCFANGFNHPLFTILSRRQERRFLVIDPVQLILVEPDSKRLGWGVVKFVGFLQDVEVAGDKEDSRLLHVVVHKPQSSVHAKPIPILSARCTSI